MHGSAYNAIREKVADEQNDFQSSHLYQAMRYGIQLVILFLLSVEVPNGGLALREAKTSLEERGEDDGDVPSLQ